MLEFSLPDGPPEPDQTDQPVRLAQLTPEEWQRFYEAVKGDTPKDNRWTGSADEHASLQETPRIAPKGNLLQSMNLLEMVIKQQRTRKSIANLRAIFVALIVALTAGHAADRWKSSNPDPSHPGTPNPASSTPAEPPPSPDPEEWPSAELNPEQKMQK